MNVILLLNESCHFLNTYVDGIRNTDCKIFKISSISEYGFAISISG